MTAPATLASASDTKPPWSLSRMFVRTVICRSFSRRAMMLGPRTRLHPSQFTERYPSTARRRDQNLSDGRWVGPRLRHVPDRHVEPALSLEHCAHGAATKRQFDMVLVPLRSPLPHDWVQLKPHNLWSLEKSGHKAVCTMTTYQSWP
jgi:hypothetical protein